MKKEIPVKQHGAASILSLHYHLAAIQNMKNSILIMTILAFSTMQLNVQQAT